MARGDCNCWQPAEVGDWRKRRRANLPPCGGDARRGRGGAVPPTYHPMACRSLVRFPALEGFDGRPAILRAPLVTWNRPLLAATRSCRGAKPEAPVISKIVTERGPTHPFSQARTVAWGNPRPRTNPASRKEGPVKMEPGRVASGQKRTGLPRQSLCPAGHLPHEGGDWQILDLRHSPSGRGSSGLQCLST